MIVYGITAEQASPSSRRAWIEIRRYNPSCVPRPVALLAEGVDRNMLRQTVHGILYSRPPRGGRG